MAVCVLVSFIEKPRGLSAAASSGYTTITSSQLQASKCQKAEQQAAKALAMLDQLNAAQAWYWQLTLLVLA